MPVASWIAPLMDALARGEPAMLVHVAAVRGSAPREPGARMLVTGEGFTGTIGGGELEHQAIRQARERLAGGRGGVADRALGPELGQCCGGAVTLLFEPFAPSDLAWLEPLSAAVAGRAPIVRSLAIGRDGAMRREWQVSPVPPAVPLAFRRVPDGVLVHEWLNPAAESLFVFGAGHVGRAVVRAVEPLGFAITWIDGRANAFPPDVPAGVRTVSLAVPEGIVAQAPPGAYHLVMTHSHPLDEEVCAAILARGDFAYLGLIGSATKRARFLGRLRRRGIPAPALDRLTCPIGLPAITGKEPAVIAVSVAADLLVRREADRALRPAAAPADAA